MLESNVCIRRQEKKILGWYNGRDGGRPQARLSSAAKIKRSREVAESHLWSQLVRGSDDPFPIGDGAICSERPGWVEKNFFECMLIQLSWIAVFYEI